LHDSEGETDMDTGMASDEVTDMIAHIEMHRQEMAKEAGLAAACNETLRKLHELLKGEQEALQRQGPGSRHSANVEAVTKEIKRVKNLAGGTSQGSNPKNPRPGQHQVSLRAGVRNPVRSKGRRTMGRHGER
jgi:hypothetical protein